MFIERVIVLNMVDDAAHFSAAQFVEPLTTEPFLETMLTLLQLSTLDFRKHNSVIMVHNSKTLFVQIC